MSSLKPIGPAVWEIERHGDMRVPARVYANEAIASRMGQDRTLGQLANVAALPGIVNYAAVMPDGHEGYGFPIGGVAAFDPEFHGVISPGGVGYDINCLHLGTQVITDLGYFLPIEKIGENLAVEANGNGFSLSFVKQKLKVMVGSGTSAAPRPIVAFMKKKADKRSLRLRMKTGQVLECSEDHPIATPIGMMPAGQVKAGMPLAVSYFEGTAYEKSEFENERETGIIAKFFGYLLGDGCITRCLGKYRILAYGKQEDIERIRVDLTELGIKSSITAIERQHAIQTQYGEKHFTGHTTELRIYSKDFAEKLIALGYPLGRKTDQAFRVPQWLMRAPKWLQRLFLAGFFGAELSSPSTHSKTGFYAPILGQNKSAALEDDGRAFLIDLMQMLQGFGVNVTKIASRNEHPNNQGAVVRLRLEIAAEEDNLLRLWRNVGFEYNAKRSRLGQMACAYILGKKRLHAMRMGIAHQAKELGRKGIRLKEAQRLLVLEGVANAHFIERHYHENDAGQRITLDFQSFDEFVTAHEEEYALHGALFDEVESVEEFAYEGEVYDITVEETHKFFANGILVSNCGVRLLTTNIDVNELSAKKRQLVDGLFANVPSGVGSKGKLRLQEHQLREAVTRGVDWAIEQGYGRREDALACEENGCMQGANWDYVSPMARKRGLPQFGTVGAGNHFVEIQQVQKILLPEVAKRFGLRPGQVVVMIHSGSRGFGHQVCDDHLKMMISTASKYNIHLPDRELCCAPIGSQEADHYLGAMKCAVNFAFNNRHIMMHWVRQTFDTVFGRGTSDEMNLVYDVCHNIAKFEEHMVDGQRKTLCVHRKGATRAFAAGRMEIPSKYRDVGQPVIIPGSMGTASYVLVGKQGAMDQTWGSTCHGAGRQMSRSRAAHTWTGADIAKSLGEKNIMVKATESELIAEEAPGAYKDVDEVVASVEMAGLSDIVARLIPMAVVKG